MAMLTLAQSCPASHPESASVAGGFGGLLDWFAGNGAYQNLYHCMGADVPWIATTITLDLVIAAGYLLIAKHWWVNERNFPDSPARRALRNMRNIFLLCGLCGYLFIPIKMFWPAWRLYDFVLLVLAYVTWKYAWGAKDLKVLYAELGRTNRLQAELDKTREESRQKSFFLNAVSHDLRTPLNGLTLQASLAEIGLASNDADAVRQAVAGMKSSARATADLLESLLEYTRLDWISEPNNASPFSLKDAVEAACLTPRATAVRNGLTLVNRVPAGLIMTSDRVKFERILGNLLTNAVKFTRTGGVRVEAQRSGHDLELHVIDTGIGIAPEHQDRIFEEFFQVHNHERDRSKGFGLGLPIARRLARQLGGDIHLESTEGGSRFTIVLPGVLREPATVAVGQPAVAEPAPETVAAG